jgi:hypothetical protein
MKYNATAIQQHEAAKILNHHYRITGQNILGDGLKLCRRKKAFKTQNPDVAQIEIKQSPNGRIFANMHDVAHCGNAHLCSYCSSTKATHMRKWINQLLIRAVQKAGLDFCLFSLTASHKRESSWTEFTKNFFKALSAFSISMKREFDNVGSLGRVRALESPVGSNGLHIHIHDLLTYKSITDFESFRKIALRKWKSALRKFDLHCSNRGVDIKPPGTFDLDYVAKEVAAHDTKTDSKSDLITLFKLLDESARGNKQAADDWIRAAIALQGRDRWNVGQLAKKLGIPSPSEWNSTEGEAKTEPFNIIEYPQTAHMMATEPSSKRNGLAMILRTARQNLNNEISTRRIVEALCRDYTKQKLLSNSVRLTDALSNVTDNINSLLKLGAITEELANELVERAVVEIEHQKTEKSDELSTKLQVAMKQQLQLKPNAELEFS